MSSTEHPMADDGARHLHNPGMVGEESLQTDGEKIRAEGIDTGPDDAAAAAIGDDDADLLDAEKIRPRGLDE